MAVKKGGLGKGLQEKGGLNNLIPDKKPKKKDNPVEKIVDSVKPDEFLPINMVEPNRNQPRKQFDEEALEELASSIKKYGILQPLLVQKKDDFYEIIAGERRWRAAKLAKLKKVPVIIKELSEQEVVEISLIENIQREDLNPIEEAKAYYTLMTEYHLKQEDIALQVSKSRTAVANSMRLLKLADEIQTMLVNGVLSSGHARALLAIENHDMQLDIANSIIKMKLNVRETEKLVKRLLNQKPRKEEEKSGNDIFYRKIEEQLKELFGTKVIIQNKKKKGKIEIEYYSQEDFERIYEMIQNINNL